MEHPGPLEAAPRGRAVLGNTLRRPGRRPGRSDEEMRLVGLHTPEPGDRSGISGIMDTDLNDRPEAAVRESATAFHAGRIPLRVWAFNAAQRYPNAVAVAFIAGVALLPLLVVTTFWRKAPMPGEARIETVPRRVPDLAAVEALRPRQKPPAIDNGRMADVAGEAAVDGARSNFPRVVRRYGAAVASSAAPARAPRLAMRPARHRTHHGTQVVIRRRAGSAHAAHAAKAVAVVTRHAGFEVAAVHADSLVPMARVVRYFHNTDAEAAERLAGRLGSGWQTQDFRAFSQRGRPGVLEVWLPDR
jgi:hypothetical protein